MKTCEGYGLEQKSFGGKKKVDKHVMWRLEKTRGKTHIMWRHFAAAYSVVKIFVFVVDICETERFQVGFHSSCAVIWVVDSVEVYAEQETDTDTDTNTDTYIQTAHALICKHTHTQTRVHAHINRNAEA